MSARLATWLVVAAFSVTVLIRLPATALTLLLPHQVHCDDPSGTLWQGACGQFQGGGLALNDLHWTLHPGSLLGARLRLDLQCGDPRAAGRGTVTVRPGGDVEIETLSAQLPLMGGLPFFPTGWSGEIDLAIPRAQLASGRLAAIVGTATVQQLRSIRPALELGSLQLEFPPAVAGPAVGSLRDLGGPLALQGTVQLTPDGGFELNAMLAARDPANADLQQMLQLLGPPDSQGRHELSLSGTL
jgi:hypothetical protein